MIRKHRRIYLKNKLINSIKIKKYYKLITTNSTLQSTHISYKLATLVKCQKTIRLPATTSIQDVCTGSGVYRKSNRFANFSRYEFHRLCRTNKYVGCVVSS